MKTCSVPNCGRPHKSKGYCVAHYVRMSRHGDPLGGLASPAARGEPMRFYREVVLKYEGDECLTWPYAAGGKGYGKIWLDGGMKSVHRLVCEEMNGPPPSPHHEAAHSCGNGHLGCVTKAHLSWKTPKENSADRFVHGTHNRGSRNYSARLNRKQVLEIRALRGIEPRRVVAERYGIAERTVLNIQSGQSWAWLKAGGSDA